ncbi:hypothetical protein ACA910_002687 [Epithemia clementina (nom. ined.)]
MPATPEKPSSSPFVQEETNVIIDEQVFMHVVDKVLQLPPDRVKAVREWMGYHGVDKFSDIINLILENLDQQLLQAIQSFKVGKSISDLPLVVLTKLTFITLWAMEQIASMNTTLPNSIWLALDKDTFNQWCISSPAIQPSPTPANPYMFSPLCSPKTPGSTTSSSATTQSFQDLSNFCKATKRNATALQMFKDE